MSALEAATKRCTKCGETKNAAEFYRHPTNKDRLHSWCKPCFGAAVRQRKRQRRAELGDEEFLRIQREAVARVRAKRGVDYEKKFNKARTAALRRLTDLHRREYEYLLAVAKREVGL